MSIETITPQLVNDLPVISGERDLLTPILKRKKKYSDALNKMGE